MRTLLAAFSVTALLAGGVSVISTAAATALRAPGRVGGLVFLSFISHPDQVAAAIITLR